jgi:polyphenol oxidase
MQTHQDGNLTWLTFDLLSEFPNLVHGVFLRHGGVSSREFSSLNFGSIQGDSLENVAENKKRALRALNISSNCSLWQKHGKQVVEANSYVRHEADGLATNLTGLGLMIIHADCQAVIFYDPKEHALANVHCGWRGNVENIFKEAIEFMVFHYHSKPENLLVGISPSLGPSAAQFINYRQELPETFYQFQIKPYYFDFWEISRWQLLQCGILPHHIEIAGICTFSHPEDFFSYRRFKASGRNATIAALKIGVVRKTPATNDFEDSDFFCSSKS